MAIVVGILIVSPDLQTSGVLGGNTLNLSSELKHQDLSAPKDGAESARIDLSLSSWPVEINTLQDSEDLITASLDYSGTLNWRASRTGSVAEVILQHQQVFSFAQIFNQDAKWQFAISPDLPMELTLDGGSGSVAANLSELQLTSFGYEGGSGPTNLVLPADFGDNPDKLHQRRIWLVAHQFAKMVAISQMILEGGSGSYNLTVDAPATLNLNLDTASGSGYIKLAENTSADIMLDGGSGSTKIVLEGNPGIRLIVENRGSGSVQLPSGLTRTVYGD